MLKRIYCVTGFIFLACFGIFVFSLYKHFDPDLWGHLRFGQYIIDNGIPFIDIFSFQKTKPIWVNHEWLSEVIFSFLYSINKNGSYLLLFKAILCSSIFLLAFYRSYVRNNKDIKGLILIISVSMLVFTYGSAIRPQLFTYFYFAILLFILDKYTFKSKISYISLPILFILWANSHGGFVAGLAITFVYALYYVIIADNKSYRDINRYKSLLLPVGMLLVPMITPYGLAYYPYIVDAITMKRPFVEEWQPLFSSNVNYLYTYILIIISLVVISSGITRINKSNLVNIIVIGITFAISLSHARHIPFFAISCAFFLPDLLPDKQILDQQIKDIAIKNIIIPIILVFLSLYFLKCTFISNNKINYFLNIAQLTTSQNSGFPVNSVIYIKNNHLSGKMLTDFNWGEFIIFTLYPQIKVSVDGRYETVYFNSTVAQNFAIINAENNWKQLLLKMDPDLILISKFDPIAKELPKYPYYKLIFNDFEGQLYVKTTTLSH